MQALYYIVSTLFFLYILTFMVRIILQWVRADFYNPLSQFIVRVTNPLVIPVRRLIPSVGRLDTATLLVALLLQMIALGIGHWLSRGSWPAVLPMLLAAIRELAVLVLQIHFFAIFIYVLLSWFNPGAHNPLTSILGSIGEPLLRPVRRHVPPIGGLDLSPLFVLIALQAVIILLRTSW